MSVENIAAVGVEPAKIRFHYKTSDILSSLELRTTYRAKNVKNEKGEAQLDDVAITQQEIDAAKEFLEEGVYDLGAEMFKMAQGVSNSIFFDSLLDGTFASGNESCGFELLDNAQYNANLLPAIDKKFQNCLKYFCLRGWYGLLGLKGDVETNDFLYKENLSRLKNLTFQLRKGSMKA